MKNPLIIVFLFFSVICFGQKEDFSIKFKADSAGLNGFRMKSFRRDSIKKIWLLNGKNLMGYSKKRIETLLGQPHNDCMFMNSTTCIYYYMKGKGFQMVLCFDVRLKVDEITLDTTDFSDSRRCGEEDVEITSSVTFLEHVSVPVNIKTKIEVEPILMKAIIRTDTVDVSYKEDSVFFYSSNIFKYLQDSLKYPEVEKEAQITGTVYLSFMLQKDSTIANVKLLRGIPGGPGIDHEVNRIISALPKQKPFKRKGKPVTVICYVPIRFKIE